MKQGVYGFDIEGIKIIPAGNKNIRINYKKRGKYIPGVKKNKVATDFIKALTQDFTFQAISRKYRGLPLEGRVYAFLYYHYGYKRRHISERVDTDNIDKGVLDALEAAGVIKDDNRVFARASIKDALSEEFSPARGRGDIIRIRIIRAESDMGKRINAFMRAIETGDMEAVWS